MIIGFHHAQITIPKGQEEKRSIWKPDRMYSTPINIVKDFQSNG
ncbi:hypothetical protein SAMN03159341_11982 [Paenibacillus sp. 1_12]|nr:hypothetical protein SAMN03159341_11982 [Paenibacillus sp. 1_12]